MDPAEIRPAVQRDAEAAAALWLRSRREALGLIPALVHSDAEVRGWMASHVLVQLECWVAETIDGTIVGLLVLEEDWVDQLYVLPGCQRQRGGSQLLDFAKRLRPHGLQVWTFASNTPARRFYDQRGFVAAEMTDGADNEQRTPDVRNVWGSGPTPLLTPSLSLRRRQGTKRSTAAPAASRSRAEVHAGPSRRGQTALPSWIRKRTVAVSTIVRSPRVGGSDGDAPAHEPVDGSVGSAASATTLRDGRAESAAASG